MNGYLLDLPSLVGQLIDIARYKLKVMHETTTSLIVSCSCWLLEKLCIFI